MRVRDAVRMFGGSVAIYVVVAACSSGGGGGGSTTSSDAGHGGSSAADAAKGHDAAKTHDAAKIHDGSRILDALTDPVKEASADDSYQSGTRIKVQRYVGADGSSSPIGLYDSQLKVPCAWATASDGTTRCLPTGSAYQGLHIPVFVDSGCSLPLLALPTPGPCTLPTYASSTVSLTAACSSGLSMFSVGSVFTGPVYTGTPGSCTAGTGLAGTTYYSLAPLMPSEFVEGTFTTDP